MHSLTISAVSVSETTTTLVAIWSKSAAAARALRSSTPPTTCGRPTISCSACPWIVRSGAIATSGSRQYCRRIGATTARVVPTGTVLRTTTSVSGRHHRATDRVASIKWLSTTFLSRSTLVLTLMNTAS